MATTTPGSRLSTPVAARVDGGHARTRTAGSRRLARSRARSSRCLESTSSAAEVRTVGPSPAICEIVMQLDCKSDRSALRDARCKLPSVRGAQLVACDVAGRVSAGPLYDSRNGHIVRAGALVLASGLVAPRAFWELLQRLARRADGCARRSR